MDAQQIVDIARSYIGTRWKHRGRSKLGVDCAGLIVCVGKDAGVTDTSRKPLYPPRPDESHLEQFEESLDRVPVNESRPGDIAIIAWQGYPCHAGILAIDKDGNMTVIHAHATARQVIEEPLAGLQYKQAQHVKTFRYRRD